LYVSSQLELFRIAYKVSFLCLEAKGVSLLITWSKDDAGVNGWVGLTVMVGLFFGTAANCIRKLGDVNYRLNVM
jgi:hypothetical protein